MANDNLGISVNKLLRKYERFEQISLIFPNFKPLQAIGLQL